MKKSDKKIENSLIEVLTEVCDIACEEYDGFKWLTHFVNYNRFPSSLSIVCVMDTNADLDNAIAEKFDDFLRSLIKEKLSGIHIEVKDIRKHVRFDTEENCKNENDGKWSERFK